MTRSSMKFSGDTTLTQVPADSVIDITDGTLTINCRMGTNVRITQRGSGEVVINAATNEGSIVQAEGNVSVVTAAKGSHIDAGGDIKVKYGVSHEVELNAPNGNITIGNGIGNNCKLNAQSVELCDNIGQNCIINAAKIIGGGHIGANTTLDGNVQKEGFVGMLARKAASAPEHGRG